MRVPTLDHRRFIDVSLPEQCAPKNCVAFPALIDPHVHFRTPGATHKEDWQSASRAAIAGGVTTVFDMPNTEPATVNRETLEIKKRVIDEQLKQVSVSLRYHLYLGATSTNAKDFETVKNNVIGIKLFMGSSTGGLLVDNANDQERIFQEAARLDMIVAVHAEDEEEIRHAKETIPRPEVRDHSRIRSRTAAIKAVENAIALAKKHGAKLYICHVSTSDEVDIIRDAKNADLPVYAEVTPHHLFLDESSYATLGTLAQMNPPLRTLSDCDALWKAIRDGVIDTIGSDHAPHTREEKAKSYPQSPSGVPGIETTLPLLLTAARNGKITMEKIVELTRTNVERIFSLPTNDDWVVVDLSLTKEVKNAELKTKCGWSPFAGWQLTGWPVAVTVRGSQFIVE